MKAERERGGTPRAGNGEGENPSAGSTFIHKTKAESDKERIVGVALAQSPGPANALVDGRE